MNWEEYIQMWDNSSIQLVDIRQLVISSGGSSNTISQSAVLYISCKDKAPFHWMKIYIYLNGFIYCMQEKEAGSGSRPGKMRSRTITFYIEVVCLPKPVKRFSTTMT